jgi:hypothetical protein
MLIDWIVRKIVLVAPLSSSDLNKKLTTPGTHTRSPHIKASVSQQKGIFVIPERIDIPFCYPYLPPVKPSLGALGCDMFVRPT